MMKQEVIVGSEWRFPVDGHGQPVAQVNDAAPLYGRARVVKIEANGWVLVDLLDAPRVYNTPARSWLSIGSFGALRCEPLVRGMPPHVPATASH